MSSSPLLTGALRVVVASATIVACATLGPDGKGDSSLPTAGVGPFRRLESKEVPGVPPTVLDHVRGNLSEPAVLRDERGDVVLFATLARKNGDVVIVRSRATDGRGFFGAAADPGHEAPTVLEPSPEEGFVRGASALRVGAEVWVYYASNRGIGLARSTDGGHTFAKSSAPVLDAAGAGPWEHGPPAAPSVVRLPDGRFRLFFASGGAIGEAESVDGQAFRRLDPQPSTPEVEPVLGPRGDVSIDLLALGEKPPFDAFEVGDPDASFRVTEGDRFHMRVLYTGVRYTAGSAVRALGFAARYGDQGPLERQSAPVLSSGKGEAAPALLEGDGLSLVFFQAVNPASKDGSIIAAGVAPATLRLPEPAPFPSTP